ncbi:MAG: DUF4339 domain-containing protein [Rubritalea sp.]|uniref:RDD family protein n=1 Tax=Rubritalea sp. TaxID=2109375 RepID=UPI003241FA69
MKVWLLVNEEKLGPFETFEVRERIDAGELTQDTLCWYQGAASWGPLGEVAQFETMFDQVEEVSDLVTPPPIPESVKNQAEKIKEALAEELSKAPPLHAIRRFFARMHDFLLYMVLVFAVFQEKVLEMGQSDSVVPLLAVGFAYVLLDAIMIHLWKVSPGKFLLGMRTTDAFGHAIPLKFSVLRSLRMWILAMGMGVIQIWPFSLGISWFLSRRFGFFLWDIPRRYRVVARPFSGMRVVAYVASIFAMSLFLNMVLPEALLDEMRSESWMQEFIGESK